MIKIKNDFNNSKFLEFCGVTNNDALQNFEERKLFELIKEFNQNNIKEKITCITEEKEYNSSFGYAYFSTCAILEDKSMRYGFFLEGIIDDIIGDDFLNLNIKNFEDVPYGCKFPQLEKFYDENNLDFYIEAYYDNPEGYAGYDNYNSMRL